MNTYQRQVIYHFVKNQFHTRFKNAPNESLLPEFIQKAEAGNEMAIIYLAEWLETLIENHEHETDAYKKLNGFFMSH